MESEGKELWCPRRIRGILSPGAEPPNANKSDLINAEVPSEQCVQCLPMCLPKAACASVEFCLLIEEPRGNGAGLRPRDKAWKHTLRLDPRTPKGLQERQCSSRTQIQWAYLNSNSHETSS